MTWWWKSTAFRTEAEDGRSAVINLLDRILRMAAASCLLVLFVLIVLQVVLRYGFSFTPFFTEEIGRYALVWGVLIGMAVAVHSGEHIRVTFLQELISARKYWLIQFALELICLVVFAVLTRASIESVSFAEGQTSDGLQLSLQYPYAILPVAFGSAFIFNLVQLRSTWAARPWKSAE